MHGLDCGPHSACDVVLLVRQGAKSTGLPLADERFGRQPDAGPGTKAREVRAAAAHLPAEHESVSAGATGHPRVVHPGLARAGEHFRGGFSNRARENEGASMP
jgi:hypothetical protein